MEGEGGKGRGRGGERRGGEGRGGGREGRGGDQSGGERGMMKKEKWHISLSDVLSILHDIVNALIYIRTSMEQVKKHYTMYNRKPYEYVYTYIQCTYGPF